MYLGARLEHALALLVRGGAQAEELQPATLAQQQRRWQMATVGTGSIDSRSKIVAASA